MEINFLNEKRQREKGNSLEELEKEMELYKGKTPKLEDQNTENNKTSIINHQNSTSNFDTVDISELVFKYNSINTDIKCKICQKDITNNIKFYCNICENYIYCINCFLLSKHNSSHSYHIIDNLNFPLYTDDWSINEEHKLLSNIAKCGLNNWEEICKSMENKGQVECESHYYSFYYTNKENPYPDETKVILDENKNIKNEQLSINKKIKNENNEKILKFTTNGGNTNEEMEREDPNVKRNSRSLCVRKNNRGGESISEILGVKPKRKEFDNEFLNDTEIEISHLEFNEEEKEKDLKIKMDILKDYNLILKEREQRKKFIFEKGLIDLRRQNRIESKLSKEEYNLLLFMRPFCRFYENSEFFDLFDGIVIEQQLKLMLKNLNKLENEKNPKGGKISTVEDIEKFFESEKNANKGRKHNMHEHNRDKEKDKDNNMNIIESNLLANRIERYYEFNKINKEKKIDEIFDKDEYVLIKEMPLSRSTCYDIKMKIKEMVTIFEEKKNEKYENLKENIRQILDKYGLERQTYMDIFDFYCKKYNDLIIINENELSKEKDNKKRLNKDNDVTYINENDEIKSESNKSNKRHKYKKNKEKNKNNKNKKNEKDKDKDKEKGTIIEEEPMKIDDNKGDNKNNKMEIEKADIPTKEKESKKIDDKEKEIKKEFNKEEQIKKEEKEEIIKKNNNNEMKGIIKEEEGENEKTKEVNDEIEKQEEKEKEINIEQTKIKYFEEN